MFLSLGHKNRINAIANQYLPSIANRNAECAGLVFANKYLLNILRDLEPNHPLLEVGLREKIGRWGSFTFNEVDGNHAAKFLAAFQAGESFSMPKFEPVVDRSSVKGLGAARLEKLTRELREKEFRQSGMKA